MTRFTINSVLREEDNGASDGGGGEAEELSATQQFLSMPAGAETPTSELPDGDGGEGASVEANPDPGAEGGESPSASSQGDDQSMMQQVLLQNQQMLQNQQNVQNQPQQQPQYTPEQMDELLGVYTANEDLVARMFGETATPETQMAALQELINRTSQHAIKTAGYTQQFATRDMEAKFQPALQAARRQTQDTFTNNVEKAYPGFEGKRDVVNQVIAQMQSEGWVPTGPPNFMAQEAGQEVAARVTHLIRMVDPTFDPTVTKSTPTKEVTTMAEMGGGGQGGGGLPSTSSNNNIPEWKQALA